MSKYAHILPDIDTGPDTYETTDSDSSDDKSVLVAATSTSSPPSAQATIKDGEDPVSGIIKSRIAPSEASARFANTGIDATEADFSGRVGGRKKGAQYRAYTRSLPDSDEYDIVTNIIDGDSGAERGKESKLQKLRRLVYEVQELEEEAQRDRSKEANDLMNQIGEAKPIVSQITLLDQIYALQVDLVNVSKLAGVAAQDAPSLSDDSSTNISGSLTYQAELSRKLMSQIQSFKAKINSNTSANIPFPTNTSSNDRQAFQIQPSKSSSNNAVMYELYYAPDTAKLAQLSQMTSLEARIANLERIIGASYVDTLTNSDDFRGTLVVYAGSLIAAMEQLESHLSLLTQSRRLESVSHRVKSLTFELDRLTEAKKKQQLESSIALHSSTYGLDVNVATNDGIDNNDNVEDGTRIGNALGTLEKLDPLINLIPNLLSRLQSLRALHTEAAVFAESLSMLTSEQKRVTESTVSMEVSLTGLHAAIKDNATVVDSNVAALDVRINVLLDRINKLQTITV
ncbi:hypothetical protein SeLEV6574_g07484 [Synchytrium endobioticum]|uniref:Dynactin subunit 2 n=1 Tax=Synchytrium endobioticum TaxID=286115 RepID=A0A507CKL8_9FUNG|nr:hypothetical protein SeLEV6574_g07484 [Synchytrium endobioticum]